jgi:hypothetical protein
LYSLIRINPKIYWNREGEKQDIIVFSFTGDHFFLNIYSFFPDVVDENQQAGRDMSAERNWEMKNVLLKAELAISFISAAEVRGEERRQQ